MRPVVLLAFGLLAACATSAPAGPAASPAPTGGAAREAGERRVIPFNRDWAFAYRPDPALDSALAAPDADDAAWQAVALPHTWATYETTGEVHPFIYAPSERDDPYWWYGWGWYRKRFTPDRALADGKLFAEFDGAQKKARVYLNGAFVGEHLGGYTSFSVDLTPHVRWGGENVLAVAVQNRRDDADRVPPMTAGNFDVYGGLYRDVRLVATGRVYVPFQGAADYEGGTFVTTPVADSARGVARVRTFVRNEHADAREVAVETTVLDPDGREVARMASTQTVAPGTTAQFDQTSAEIPRPRLWSPETPAVYAVQTEVYDGGRLVDTWESPLGFRTFHWDHDQNKLVLNGRPLRINGTNRHQEYPWLGDALPEWVTRRDLLDVRDGLGHNFMRGAHYPNRPLVYALTDSLGIVTVEEVPNIKSIDFSETVQERNVREMVRRDRNHPSVLFWSMGNETDDAADSRWAVEEDTTRIVHLRKGEDGGDYVTHTHEDLDLENLLRVTVRGWATQDDVPPGVDGRPENGQHASTETWQHGAAQIPDASVRGSIDRDVVLWLYADHGADREYRNAPVLHVNPKGWVDAYRQPKYVYWLWRATFADTPTVFVHPHVWRRALLGTHQDVTVDANCEAVELRVGGRAVGRRALADAPHAAVVFPDVEVVDASLEAVCLGRAAAKGERTAPPEADGAAPSGGTVWTGWGPETGADGPGGPRHVVPMAGRPARLVLRASHEAVPADRSGLAVVLAEVVDAEGNLVQDALPPLTWSVEGPGRLVGPDAFEADRGKVEERAGTMYTALPVGNVVRSTATPGTVVVRVSSPGLAPAEVAVEAVPPEPAPFADLVRQPPLRDAGRRPVRRDPTFQRPTALPEVVGAGRARRPLRVVRASVADSAGVRAAVSAFVRGVSPEADTATAAYRAFAEALAEALGRTGGVVVEDDYNVLAERHDDALRLERLLDRLPLHPDYRAVAARAYADEAVRRGTVLDLDAERARLALAVGGRVLDVSPDHGPGVAYAHVPDLYRVRTAPLAVLVALLEPGFADLDAGQRARALALVDALNPHVRPAAGGGYEVDEGEVVLVPPLAALRAP